MIAPLTRRQREVLALAAEGLQSREIAERLSVAPKTVESLLANAYAALGARNRAHAVYLATSQGLIEREEQS